MVGLRGRALDAQFLKGLDLKPLPASFSLNALKTANGVVADLDGDGATELLVGNAILSLKGQAKKDGAVPKGQAVGDKGQVKKAPPRPPEGTGQERSPSQEGTG